MKRILTLFFVLVVSAIATDHGQAQGPYGPAPHGAPMGYAPPAPNYGPSPYGAPPAPMGYPPAGYVPAAYSPQGGYPPAGYAPQGPMPGYAPQGPMGPMPGHHPGPMPAAYMQQPPQPMPPQGYGPEPGYGPPQPMYGQPSYDQPMYGQPMYSDPGSPCGEGACSSCGANYGACGCGLWGRGILGSHCGFNPLKQVFGGLEFLSWYRHGTNLPPLVTTSPQGTSRDDAGQLGLPGTRTLLGGNDERFEGDMGGVRLTLGTWFDPQKEYGLVYRFTTVGGDDFGYNLNSNNNGVPTIARPFFNTDSNEQDAILIAFNDPTNGVYATGNIQVGLNNEITNHDLYALLMISKGCGWRTDLVFGYQNSNIDETLSIRSFTTVQDPRFLNNVFAAGTTIDILDTLAIENEFHGGTLGLQTELQHGPWSLRMLGKFAVGGTTSRGTISGRTITTAPTTPPTVAETAGGLLAQPTNIGSFEAESTTISPEATLTLGYSCTKNLRLTAGYSFLYWTHIVPANALIDTNVNPTQRFGGGLTGDPSPSPVIIGDTDFWVMGLNLGGEYRY